MSQDKEPLVLGIEEMYRNHPIPNLPNFKIVPFNDPLLEQADIYIQNNIIDQKRKKFKKYYQYIIDSGKPYICVESAVFRRNMKQPPHPKAYHRYSWFSYFRDEGLYNNLNSSGDRWKKIQQDQNIEIKDWRHEGEYILLIMQRPGDSSLKNLMAKHGDYESFITNVLNEIRTYTDRKIRIRLHPLRQEIQHEILKKINAPNIEISTNIQGAGLLEGGNGLYEDFKHARVVVGFNSNALTESVCEGIPTFSLCPSSMAWECSNHDLKYIETPVIDLDRTYWLRNLGYCQWSEEEIERGDPWYHLRSLYPDNLAR
jgi:hypothetical protein|tara:strand:- start:10899 stop:11840 length:942 start_codon:yes stop_codon:yes gene_type:complete